MSYQAVIFDLDGTLLNTLEDLRDAVNHALAEQDMPLKDLEQIREYVGNGIVKLVERALPDGRENPAFDRALQSFKAYYAKHCQDRTAPYPGVLKVLKTLKEKEIPVAVVSNKAEFAVKELMPVYFPGLITVAYGENEEAGIRKKPSPDMVYQALSDIGCEREHAVYVGDSDVDLMTAKNAQMDCIGVSWGFRGRQFLEEHGVTQIADDAEELLSILLKK